MTPTRILSVFGTRPEAIKMAPVLRTLQDDPGFAVKVCVTAQHRQMLDQVLRLFEIEVDHDLDLMREDQSLTDLTARILRGVAGVLEEERPDLVIVQGDTTTCFATALAAFYREIPVAHIEAGLRTWNIQAPFPEEINRAIVGKLAHFHFAPTEAARQNLLSERVPDDRIWVTGNTVIDALLSVRDKLPSYPPETWQQPIDQAIIERFEDPASKKILVTGHRRESFGEGFQEICEAIRQLAAARPNWVFVYPVHLNPNVQRPVKAILGDLDNVHLIEPLDYLPFIWLMARCDLALTDSGGIQEEAPSLGKPVIVMRENTERPEGVEAGTALLAGADRLRITESVERVLCNNDVYQRMAQAHNPYGDGHAAERIHEVLAAFPHRELIA